MGAAMRERALAELRFRYRGHNQSDSAREFLFKDTARVGVRLISISITTAQLNRHGIRLQDAPRLCLQFLTERIAGQPTEDHVSFAMSDTDIAAAIAGTTPIMQLNKRLEKVADRMRKRST